MFIQINFSNFNRQKASFFRKLLKEMKSENDEKRKDNETMKKNKISYDIKENLKNNLQQRDFQQKIIKENLGKINRIKKETSTLSVVF